MDDDIFDLAPYLLNKQHHALSDHEIVNEDTDSGNISSAACSERTAFSDAGSSMPLDESGDPKTPFENDAALQPDDRQKGTENMPFRKTDDLRGELPEQNADPKATRGAEDVSEKMDELSFAEGEAFSPIGITRNVLPGQESASSVSLESIMQRIDGLEKEISAVSQALNEYNNLLGSHVQKMRDSLDSAAAAAAVRVIRDEIQAMRAEQDSSQNP